jgi:AcrR family transcriptional regulator
LACIIHHYLLLYSSKVFDVSTRDQNSIQIKTAVYKSFVSLAAKNNYEDVHVIQICEKVNISKVTFFKYFHQKEEVLRYFFRVWCLQRAIEYVQIPLSGQKAINHLFEKMTDTYLKFPDVPSSYINYISKFKIPPKPVVLTASERQMLFPKVSDVESMEIVSIQQMVENFVLEALLAKEISKNSDVKGITNLILSLLFGSAFVIGMRNIGQPRLFYRKNLTLIFDSLR